VERRRLGQTDLEITPIGLGAWAIGGGDWCLGWGPQSDDQSVSTLRKAVQEGMNWIDTAGGYGLGRSETLIARAFRSSPQRPRPYVFTKAGLVWDDLGNVSRNLTPKSIRRQAEDSLRRLRVDALDLYQLEIPDARCPLPQVGTPEGAWDAIAELKREGKARWIGLANAQLRDLALERIAPVETVQFAYSLLQRESERNLLPYAVWRRIGVLAASPMEFGLLTGTWNAERLRSLPHNDWRRCSESFKADKVARTQPLVARLRALGEDRGVSPGAIAVAWVLRYPVVAGAVVGARRPDQVTQIAGATRVSVTAAEAAWLEAALPKSGGLLDAELDDARLEHGALQSELRRTRSHRGQRP
jgi:aryl-alcohol dehydrogenase-like predicted oxidoreductase